MGGPPVVFGEEGKRSEKPWSTQGEERQQSGQHLICFLFNSVTNVGYIKLLE